MSSHSFNSLTIADVEAKLIPLRGQSVLLDRDVAALYGVETKRINEAVRNNADKFPAEYMYELDTAEVEFLRSNFSSAKISSKSRVSPHAFTERGLYMLATILKSPRATQVTFVIIETFAKVRALKRELLALHDDGMPVKQKTSMLKHFGEILADLVMPDSDSTETESSLEHNFLVGKLKHTVRRIKKGGKR
jgi:hypothetical protein